ncbi:hypothetical protein SLS56_000847 [Neofusicoccum ribis]|uniref:Restriction of telomere capping protein 4 n=1 Tax=Neofusicoccum ribis TaxID=45134 RepID=A0ABR3TCR5_9PEZI
MPQLRRTSGKPLLKSLNRPNASSSSRPSPSSALKPTPTQDGVNAEPNSPSSEGGSDRLDPPSPPAKTSPYKLPKGQTAFPAPKRRGGNSNGKRTRGSIGGTAVRGTQDSGIGLSDSSTKAEEGEDMGLFGMGAPSKKARKTTSYTDLSRSIQDGKVKKGYGFRAGAKSAQSTPRSKPTKDDMGATRASTGRAKIAADKKGTPFSNIPVNTATLSADRLPGKYPDCGIEKRRGKGQLKTLDEIELPSPSPKKVAKIQILDKIEPPAPIMAPKLKVLDSIKPQSPVQKENIHQLKLLDDIVPSHLHNKDISWSKIGVKKRAQGGLPSSEHSRRGRTMSESNDCEIIDMSTFLEQNKLRTNKSEKRNSKSIDAPSPSKTKAPELKMLDDIDPPTSSNSSTKPSGQRRSKRGRKDGEVSAAATSGSRPSPPTGSDHSERTSPPSFSVLDDEADEADDINPAGNYEQSALCPICRTPVDRLLLEEWQGSKLYMRINKQIAFCEAHKRATAAEEYAAREYPAVAFGALAARAERFRAGLVEVVRRERPSAFRDAAAEAAALGRGRNMLATSRLDEGLTGMSVGYYGPRGRRAMETWVTARLADEIRVAAGRDRLIGYKSVSGFIQEVLVPELAMRLVAEDLDVGEARAREVLAESGEIGELVNGVDEDEGGEKDGGGERVVVDDDNGDY